MFEIKHSAGDEWEVSVRGSVITHHHVRVTKADLARFAEGREPNTSILGSFDLPVIGSYFPEYEEEIRVRLRRGK